MNYLKLYEKFIKENNSYENRIILKALSSSKSWRQDSNLLEHWEYKYDYTLSSGYVLSIIGMKKQGETTMVLYINNDDKLYMVDYVIDPYNKLHSGLRFSGERDPQGVLDWCVKLGEDQSQFFIERETLPSDGELRDTFIELSDDLGYVLTDISYGYTNVPFPKAKPDFDGETLFEVDENPYWNKSHKSSEHPKIVMFYEQPRGPGLEVSIEDLKEQIGHLKKRLDIFGYKVKCDLYITQTRYYQLEHRPENFIIVIENTRITNRVQRRKLNRSKVI